ncbi:MAG: mechanosensitive ion channel family protein [Planctomycetota bacterium]
MRHQTISTRGPIAGVFCFTIAGASSAWGQEITDRERTEELVDEITQRAAVAQETLLDALALEPEALKTVAAEYLGGAVMALLILVAGYLVASFCGQLVSSVMAQRVDVMLGRFLGRLITYTVMIMVVLGVLGGYGIDVTSFAAILAAGGFAIGLALQGSLANFAAGIMLLVFRPFKIGDYVRVGDSKGTVYELDLFTTRLDTPDNRRLIVPNGEVFGKVIENYSHNPTRRVDVSVGVAYSADIRETRQALEAAIGMLPGAVSDPVPQAVLCDLGDSAVNWQVRIWCRPQNYWEVREAATAAVKQALDHAQIGIPYPQLDVHVVPSSAALARAA